MKADVVASFIALENEKALFVGLYRRTGQHSITEQQYWAMSENMEMKPFGLGGIGNRETAMWFDLEPLDFYKELKGRLVIRWPAGRLWWRWAKSNEFPVYAIHEESLLDAEMPAWDELCLTWKDLAVLPTYPQFYQQLICLLKSIMLLRSQFSRHQVVLWRNSKGIGYSIKKGKHCRDVNGFSDLVFSPSHATQFLYIFCCGFV